MRRFQILHGFLLYLAHPLPHIPLILLMKYRIRTPCLRHFKIRNLILIARRYLLRNDLPNLINVRVNSLTGLLSAAHPPTDRPLPVLMVPVLAGRRNGLFDLGDLFRAAGLPVVAHLALGAAGGQVGISLDPADVVGRHIFAGTGHQPLVFGVLIEERLDFDTILQGVAVLHPVPLTCGFALWRYVALDFE